MYYPLGEIYGKAIPEARSSVQATKASAENLNLLQAGCGKIAFTLDEALSDAWRSDAEAGFKAPLKKLRGVAGIAKRKYSGHISAPQYPQFIYLICAVIQPIFYTDVCLQDRKNVHSCSCRIPPAWHGICSIMYQCVFDKKLSIGDGNEEHISAKNL